MICLNLTPVIYKNIYTRKVNGFLMLYSPYSLNGITLLDQKSSKLMKQINGVMKIKDYLAISNNLQLGFTKSQVIKFFDTLYRNGIINFEGKKYGFFKEKTNNKRITVWLYLTNQCNFRCTYCFVYKNSIKMSESMAEKIVVKLYEIKKKYKYEEIKLTLAGGEPLLEFKLIKNIIEKVRQLDKKNKIFKIGVVSNGSLLTKEIGSYFKENHISIGISVDGIGDINNLNRKLSDGSGTFELINRGIKIAQEYNILSNFSTTITSESVNGLPELVKFCLERNINIVFGLYRKTNKYCNESLISDWKIIVLNYKKVLKMIYSYYEKNNINQSPLLGNRLLGVKQTLLNLSENNCSAGKNYFSITPEGHVQFCPSSNLKLADLENKDFLYAARKASAPFLNRMSVNKIKLCQKCRWKYYICSGGCMLERLYLNSDEPTYKCKIYKAIIPMILQFEAKRMIKMSLLALVDKENHQ